MYNTHAWHNRYYIKHSKFDCEKSTADGCYYFMSAVGSSMCLLVAGYSNHFQHSY